MRLPAARKLDKVVALDTHTVILANGAQVLLPFHFEGVIEDRLSRNVWIMRRRAATVGSIAFNRDFHRPPDGAAFLNPPSDEGRITTGSATVRINGKAAARSRDVAATCSEPDGQPAGMVVVDTDCTVFIG
jgi:uncharacterized Zn-binding protein involved in type VI secretion